MKKNYFISLLSVIMLLMLNFNSNAQGYNVSLAQQCNLTTGGTEVMSFTGTLPNANGAGTLTIAYEGDLNSGGEIITFNGETGAALGITAFIPQCTGRDSVIYTIPMATINAWAATGSSIDISAVSDISVNAGLSGCTMLAAFCVTGKLVYPFATGDNDAGASNMSPTRLCPGSDTVRVQLNNYGTNQINSVTVNWSKNGVLQTPILYSSLLDTVGGTGSPSATISLGAHTFTAGSTENFKVWTSMPNSVVDTTVLNDTTRLSLKPSLSGIYTIGGAAPDYTTFAAALADLNAIGLCGPIVFNVRQGTYTEQIDFLSINGSSSTNTITFQPDKSNTAPVNVTHAATTVADNFVVKFTGSEHVTFDSLTFTATGPAYGYVINFPGTADHITFKNCNIVGATAYSTLTNLTVIYNQSNSAANNITFNNNTISGGSYGYYNYGVNSSSDEEGHIFTNNKVMNFSYMGIYNYYQKNILVENNEFQQNPAATSTSYGLYCYQSDSVKIKGNKVVLEGTGTNYGLYLAYSYGSARNPTEVYNNMVVTSPSSTATSRGLYLNYGKHIKVYHNSVNVRGGSATGGSAMYLSGSTSTAYGDMDVRNNILVNSGPGFAMYANTGATSGFLTNLDNNIYLTAGTNLISLNGAFHTLPSWVTATAFDANSINAVPGFLSQTDLHVQGGIAFDNGDATLGVMTDFDGQTRPMAPTTGYDIGADEYIPPTCPSGYGIANFNITGTTIDITWTAGPSDTGWIVEYGAPGFTLGTGTNISSSNDTISLTGLTAVTNYDIYVRGICGVGDTSIWFNSTFQTGCLSMMSGAYTIDATLPTAGTNFASFTDAANTLNTCGVSGPTTINVKQGTYTEQFVLNSFLGSSRINMVTFQPDPTNTTPVILTYSASTTADNYVVRFDGASYVTMDSITITAAGTSYGYGVSLWKGNNITVKNCNISSTVGTNSNLVPIHNDRLAANIIENVTIENNTITGGYYSIYMYGGSSAVKEEGNAILGNTITDGNTYMIYSYYQKGNRIENNTIEQISTATSSSYGIYAYYNDSVKIKSNNVILHGSGTNYGIYLSYSYASARNSTEVFNNMVSTSSTSTGTSYGMYLNYGKNIKVYHNTINVNGGSATGGRAITLYGSTSTTYGNVDVRNNIFVNSATGNAMYINTGAISGFLTNMDNNIYFTNGANLISLNGTTHTLGSYVIASALDSNSIQGNPLFTSPTDLHVNGGIAYDNGDATLGLMIDIDGDARPLAPSTGYDIGADEYIPPTCPSPYNLSAFNTTPYVTDLTWIQGSADRDWEVQYGATGFTLGTGTNMASLNDTTTISSLTSATCYDVYIRSICTVGDTSLWYGPYNFCTKCAPVADYCTDFESDLSGSTPFCWSTYLNTTSTGYINTITYSGNSNPNCVRMYNAADASATMMLISPAFSTLSSGTHRANFFAKGDTTVIVGTMSDPANPGTFTPWDTLHGITSGYQNFKVNFDTYTGTDQYVAFLFDPHVNYDNLYIDDFCWEAIPSCEKAPSVLVLNDGVDSTNLDIGWNLDTALHHVNYMIAYGPAGYVPGDGTVIDTLYTTINYLSIGGLNSLTEYCIWVKAICANGDTSFWSGPHCGKTGCASSTPLPYFENFATYTPQCWEEAQGVLGTSNTTFTNITTSNWIGGDFGNVTANGKSARMNIYATGRDEWLISPSIDLGSTPNRHVRIEFDVALTDYFNSSAGIFGVDDTLALVISRDNGTTWNKANIIALFDTGNAPSNTGDHIVIDLPNETGVVKFGFYAASSISNEDNDVFVDNFRVYDTTFVGVEEVSQDAQFKVYPNPNDGIFTLMNEGNSLKSNIKIMDIQGRIVYEELYTFGRNARKQINLSTLRAGVYVLLVQSEGKLEQHRIVVNK